MASFLKISQRLVPKTIEKSQEDLSAAFLDPFVEIGDGYHAFSRGNVTHIPQVIDEEIEQIGVLDV